MTKKIWDLYAPIYERAMQTPRIFRMVMSPLTQSNKQTPVATE